MSGLRLAWTRRGKRGPEARPLLAIDDLSVRVGVRRVLDGICLEVFEGDHVRITGPNGCGKSTLLNAIVGIMPARIEKGRIRFGEADITAWSTHERTRLGIAYMRQFDNIFPSLTVRENLMMALGQSGYEQFAEAFPEWVADFPPDKRAGQLSGGQRKKLAWGMTVLSSASLVLTDEPEAGVADILMMPKDATSITISHGTLGIDSNVTVDVGMD